MLEEARRPAIKNSGAFTITQPRRIEDISLAPEMRLKTGLREFDRTLGGGIVPGSVVLVGGSPGIGKSTLMLQILDKLSDQGHRSLYLSGEESPQQIKLRAQRLSIQSNELYVSSGTCIEELLEKLGSVKPTLLAVDSIQTVYSNAIAAAPGSVSQVREVASQLLSLAKQSGMPVFLIGHVTKEGAIAGPKVLEHLVDTVLYFEGDRGHVFRILRSVKNRYGSTNEIGVFEMKDSGLAEVINPSRIFLEERPEDVPGSVVIPCLEGTRPVLLEMQALVGPSSLGMPRRTTVGVDHNRVSLLVAVLGKRLGIELGDQDIFVNVAGGLKVVEPASDLAIVSAIMSSFLNRPVDRQLVMFGEIGLAGEVRGVSQPDLRIREANKLGFSKCLLSPGNLDGLTPPRGMDIRAVDTIQDLHEQLFST
jgi:DNA repair protein RadA/Sms